MIHAYYALIIRVLIALYTRTFFQPDEYFQSLEPAYHIVFGYGHLTWEWLSPQPIRSIIYPALNVPIYWLLKFTGLSESAILGDWLLISCPKILHGLLAAGTDIWLAELSRIMLGRDYVSTVYLLSLTSFFHALALSRSLSNSLETSLSTIAFACYPWDASSRLSPQLMFNRSRIRKMILFSALACMTRPTNAVIWVFLYANLLWALRHHRRIITTVVIQVVFAVALSGVFLFTIDSYYYGKPTFTPLNFLRINFSSVSLFYGTNAWHYYLTQGVPILCTTALPFTMHGIWSTLISKSLRDTALKTMLKTIVWVIGIYSLAGHKEWRFIHPILPLLHIFAAKSLVDLASTRPSNGSKKGTQQNKKSQSRIASSRTFIHSRLGLPDIPNKILFFLLLSLPVSTYVILLYCSAPISVLSYIRAIPKEELGHSTVGYLMPCHSTPGHAYLHRKELAHRGIWALGCEPPLQQQNLSTYIDQTNIFYDSPIHYFQSYFPQDVDPLFPASPFPTSIPGIPAPTIISPSGERIYPWKHEWPRYLVFFGNLLQENGVHQLLDEKGYREVWKAGREWEGEGKRKGGVMVWKWFSRRTFNGV